MSGRKGLGISGVKGDAQSCEPRTIRGPGRESGAGAGQSERQAQLAAFYDGSNTVRQPATSRGPLRQLQPGQSRDLSVEARMAALYAQSASYRGTTTLRAPGMLQGGTSGSLAPIANTGGPSSNGGSSSGGSFPGVSLPSGALPTGGNGFRLRDPNAGLAGPIGSDESIESSTRRLHALTTTDQDLMSLADENWRADVTRFGATLGVQSVQARYEQYKKDLGRDMPPPRAPGSGGRLDGLRPAPLVINRPIPEIKEPYTLDREMADTMNGEDSDGEEEDDL